MARFDEFWEVICDYRSHLWLGFMVMTFFFVLALISLLLIDPSSDSFLIAIVDMVMILVVGGTMLFMYRVCATRRERYY